jgi:hypothetical protein
MLKLMCRRWRRRLPTNAGKTFALTNCARCHSINRVTQSPLSIASPFRTLHLRYAVAELGEALAEGISAIIASDFRIFLVRGKSVRQVLWSSPPVGEFDRLPSLESEELLAQRIFVFSKPAFSHESTSATE